MESSADIISHRETATQCRALPGGLKWTGLAMASGDRDAEKLRFLSIFFYYGGIHRGDWFYVSAGWGRSLRMKHHHRARPRGGFQAGFPGGVRGSRLTCRNLKSSRPAAGRASSDLWICRMPEGKKTMEKGGTDPFCCLPACWAGTRVACLWAEITPQLPWVCGCQVAAGGISRPP